MSDFVNEFMNEIITIIVFVPPVAAMVFIVGRAYTRLPCCMEALRGVS
jgi:hypothetical protein